MNVLRNYPLTIVCVLTVWYLSLFKPPSVSLLDGVDGVDKVVHTLMYAGLCSLLWLEWFRRNPRRGAWRRRPPIITSRRRSRSISTAC